MALFSPSTNFFASNLDRKGLYCVNPSSIINKHPQASSSSSIRPNALKLSLAELWSHYVPWQRLLRARSLKVSLSFQPTCRLQNWIRGCSAAGQTIVKIRLKRNALYIPKAGDRSPQLQFWRDPKGLTMISPLIVSTSLRISAQDNHIGTKLPAVVLWWHLHQDIGNSIDQVLAT